MLSVEQAKVRLQGVCVPLATIFKDDGALDVDATRSNVEWIVGQGARAGNTIFIAAGSGGDFSVLSTDERRQVIGTIAEVANGDIPVIASVQSTDIRETIKLCQFCEEVGVEFVQMSSAYYYDVKPGDMIAWVEEVARHTGVGFAAYSHWYSGSKYDVPVEVMEQLLEIPNTVAVKWASPDMGNYIEGLKRLTPKAAVVNNGGSSIYGHVLGSRAFISHVPNFLPQHSWRLWELMQAEQYVEAQKVHDDFMDAMGELRGFVASSTAGEGIFVKPWMEAAGLIAGTSRLPSRDEVITKEYRERCAVLLSEARAKYCT